MKYFVLGSTYLVRLDAGDKVMASLTSLCERDRIGAGVFSGLGAVSEAEIGYFDTSSKDYSTITIWGPAEVVSLLGNVSVKDGRPFLHAHIALADRTYGVRGGHLKEAVVAATVEVTLTRFFEEIGRTKDAGSGVDILDLKP
jgi:predicted DNA-binding protein with PD1-like motif